MEPTRAEEWVSEGGWLVELLLPRTDAGVLFQLVFVLVVSGALLWWVRHHRDARFFVGALTFFVLGLFALRAAH
jgi:hypothetical protein